MTSTYFIKEFRDGDQILRFFELRAKSSRKTRSGQDYLDLKLGDSTGEISAKLWPEALEKWGKDFEIGSIVKVEGRIEMYRDMSQLIIEKIRKADEDEVPNVSDVIKSTQYNVDELYEELIVLTETLDPLELSNYVKEILERIADQFKRAPAAMMVHHAYRGGLIEHTWSVTQKVLAILEIEPKINRSMAISGAILHDIGKLREMAIDARRRTTDGRLIGHITLGVTFLYEVALELGLENEPWLTDLEHILLSHHGEPEFGAPVRPFTREAILIHFIDNLDSRLKIIDEALLSVDSEGFSQYNKWLEGRAYSGVIPTPQEVEDV
ncbi:MAG: HD domain-containing protein [Deltaproteobacteria bacterium]|nr:HD domain-containing protein [Deltaproteobacteria bacterium]